LSKHLWAAEYNLDSFNSLFSIILSINFII